MQQRISSSNSQGKRRIWLAGGSIGFSFLLFVAIGLIILSLEGWKDFYEKKISSLDQTSIEAVMPAAQETDKVYEFLEQTDHEKIESQDALMADSVMVKLHERITTNLLIMDGSSQQVHCTVGTLGEGNSVVLPYIFKSLYGMKIKQMIQFQIGDVNYIYRISGFYEDAIFCQQDVNNRIVAYLDSASYATLKETEDVTLVKITSVQLKHPEDTNLVLDQLKNELGEQLFIGGLDLELYGSQDIASNVNLYIHYVRIICIGLGILFLLISMVGLSLVNRSWYKGMESERTDKVLIGIEMGMIPLGCIMVLFGGPWMLSRLIASLGYTFQMESRVLCLVLTCLVYCMILATITFAVQILHRTKKEETRVIDAGGTHSLLKMSRRSVAGVFMVSLILATSTLIILRIYSSTLGDADLFYEYDDSAQVIQVFHSDMNQVQEYHELKEINEYAKPVIQLALFGGMIAVALIYAIALYMAILRITNRLRQCGEGNLKGQAIPILGLILGTTLIAFLMGWLISYLCRGPVMNLLRQAAGLSIESLAINHILIVMLFGGAALIAGGVTLGTVR